MLLSPNYRRDDFAKDYKSEGDSSVIKLFSIFVKNIYNLRS